MQALTTRLHRTRGLPSSSSPAYRGFIPLAATHQPNRQHSQPFHGSSPNGKACTCTHHSSQLKKLSDPVIPVLKTFAWLPMSLGSSPRSNCATPVWFQPHWPSQGSWKCLPTGRSYPPRPSPPSSPRPPIPQTPSAETLLLQVRCPEYPSEHLPQMPITWLSFMEHLSSHLPQGSRLLWERDCACPFSA